MVNLRTRAIVLSALPLAFTLLLVIPEAAIQHSAGADVVILRRDELAASSARDIEVARLHAAGALRHRVGPNPQAATGIDHSVNDMRASMLRLESLAAPDPHLNPKARAVAAVTSSLIERYRRIDAEIRAGHLAVARAQLGAAPYLDEIDRLQAAIAAFIAPARKFGAIQLVTLSRLSDVSLVLLAVAFVGFAVSCALLLHFAVRTVNRFAAAQEARERELERYRLLAEVTQDTILFIDRRTMSIVDANAAALETYGYRREEFIGLSTQMLSPRGVPGDKELLNQIDGPAGVSFERMQRRSDGTEFPVEVHARTAEIGGVPTIVSTARNISERVRSAEHVAQALDQALEASRLKGEFVATMSHEIRTPMHGVIAMSELLLERPLGPMEREYAVTLKESAYALLAIIDDILDFSKLEANRVELEAVVFDPAQVVTSVVNLLAGQAREKGIRLKLRTSQFVPAAVSGDPTRLRQVLINLVGNAVKFTPSGEVNVSVSVDRPDERPLMLAFAVSDTGIGVGPESRDRLFEPFVQGDGSTTRRFGGTGLGLAISRRLVELMGGQIWLAEHEGPGTTFCFTARFERLPEK